MAKTDVGTCDSCAKQFQYQLIHNGFNETAYAYCDSCGRTAFLDPWFSRIPPDAQLKIHGAINMEAEPLLAHCDCGGAFRADASPRCPQCQAQLSAEAATAYIEANAPGTAKGWRWQRSWSGLYCIVIEGRSAQNPWPQG
jgi:hypothetical protein